MNRTAYLAVAALAGVALCLAGAAPAAAQGLVPAEIPTALPEATKSEFLGKRIGLDRRRAQLGAAVASQNSRCRGLAEDSPLVADCRMTQLDLNASVASYRDAVDDFNRDLAEALKTAAAGK